MSAFDMASLQLTDRDYTFLRGLFESRVMTLKQIGALYYESKHDYAIKRVRKIKLAGLIGEGKRLVNQPSVLHLTRQGFLLLERHGKLDNLPRISSRKFETRARVSERTLKHELEVMDVKVAFHSALAKSGRFSIAEFSTWPLLYEFETSRAGHGRDGLMQPDGFIRFHENETGNMVHAHDFFLEIDRSNEGLNVLAEKSACYFDYYRSGDYAVRNGASRNDAKDFAFRALVVLKSAARRNNVAERLLQNIPPIRSHTWLTTFLEITTNPLGKIWMQPGDYGNLIKTTSFDSGQTARRFEYRRQTERDRFVENNIKKVFLLG